jgi:hypothetical protein
MVENEKREIATERIFSYAVALEQAGRQRNMIFCWKDVVYILNSDKTVILQFQTTEELFNDPIGFYANDYDSSTFRVEDGAIIFVQRGVEFKREKRCQIPNITFTEVEDLFYKFLPSPADLGEWPHTSIQKASLDLLKEDLSHIEFRVERKKLYITQRDIYSGTLIELTREEGKGFKLEEGTLYKEYLPAGYRPVGIRTNDLMALYSFADLVHFYFPMEVPGHFIVESDHNSMIGVVGGCLYDELGSIKDLSPGMELAYRMIENMECEVCGAEVQDTKHGRVCTEGHGGIDGREIEKTGNGEQETDQSNKRPSLLRRSKSPE